MEDQEDQRLVNYSADDEWDVYALCIVDSNSGGVDTTKIYMHGREKNKGPDKDFLLYIDSCATGGLVCNKHLLKNIRQTELSAP
jgi:hypothetical protein